MRYLKPMDKIAAFTEILAQDPANAFARYGLAMEHAQNGGNAAALAHFDQLLTDHPDYVPGFQMAGQLLLKLGENDRAREVLQRGLSAAEQAGNPHAASEIRGLLDEVG